MLLQPLPREKRLLIGEWVFLFATAPVALFAERFSAIAGCSVLLINAIPFCIRKGTAGHWCAQTPLNGILLLLGAVFVPLSMMVSPLPWTITFPRTVCLLWSITLYFGVADWVQSNPPDRERSLSGFLFLACAVVPAAISLIALQRPDKYPDISGILSYFPDYSGPLLHRSGGVQANELAGMLTLVVPFCLTLAVGTLLGTEGKNSANLRTRRILLSTFGLFFVFALLLSQSRGGWLSCLIALMTTLLWFGRRAYVVFAVVLVSAAMIVLFAFGWFQEMFLTPSSIVGLTLDSILRGRVELWNRAVLALSAFPWTGIGLGTFGFVLPHYFPRTVSMADRFLADAHSLPLQTMLDFGIGGGVLLFAGFLMTARTLIRSTTGTGIGQHDRFFHAGLLGSFIAFSLFNITDAIAFGSRAGALLWMFLGITMTPHASARHAPEEQVRTGAGIRRMKRFPLVVVICLSALFLVFFVWGNGVSTVRGQIAKIQLLSHLLSHERNATLPGRIIREVERDGASGLWLTGLYEQETNNLSGRDSAWSMLLMRTARYIPVMHDAIPTNTLLATRAVQYQSTDAEAHFWLGYILLQVDTSRAEILLRSCVRLDPEHALGWRYLGDALRRRNPRGAIQAYLQSCYHGDPGANGCLLAGRTAESLGDFPAAIRYYRTSRFPACRSRADSLERVILRQTDTRR